MLLPTSPSSPDTAAGATLAREQEQPFLFSLQQGRSDSLPSVQGRYQNSLFWWRKLPLCLDFLVDSGLVGSRVTFRMGREVLLDSRCLTQGSEQDAWRPYEDPEGAPLRAPYCVWNSLMGCMCKGGPQLCWHPSVRSCVLSESACPGPSCLLLWRSGGTRWAHPPAHKVLANLPPAHLLFCAPRGGVGLWNDWPLQKQL